MQLNVFTGNQHLLRAVQIALAGDFSIGLTGDQNEIQRIAKGLTMVKVLPLWQSDIQVEIVAPSATVIMAKDTNDYSLLTQQRLEPALIDEAYMSRSTNALLKKAIEVRRFTVEDVETIYKVAQISASVAGEKTAKIEHFAEAIQYRMGRDKEYYLYNESHLEQIYQAAINGISFADAIELIQKNM